MVTLRGKLNGNPTRKRGSQSFPVISLANASGFQRFGIAGQALANQSL